MPTTVLVTRPGHAADALVENLRAHFGDKLNAVASPAIRIEHTEPAQIGGDETLLITSANALWAAKGLSNRAICVGQATTARAAQAGLDARCGGQTAADLARALAQGDIPGTLHYLRGEQVAHDLGDAVRAGGAHLVQSVVYRQHPCPPTPAACAALASDDPVIALVMSPATARNFAAGLSPAQKANCQVLTLSKSIAQQIESEGFNGVLISAEPTLASLIELLSERL